MQLSVHQQCRAVDKRKISRSGTQKSLLASHQAFDGRALLCRARSHHCASVAAIWMSGELEANELSPATRWKCSPGCKKHLDLCSLPPPAWPAFVVQQVLFTPPSSCCEMVEEVGHQYTALSGGTLQGIIHRCSCPRLRLRSWETGCPQVVRVTMATLSPACPLTTPTHPPPPTWPCRSLPLVASWVGRSRTLRTGSNKRISTLHSCRPAVRSQGVLPALCAGDRPFQTCCSKWSDSIQQEQPLNQVLLSRPAAPAGRPVSSQSPLSCTRLIYNILSHGGRETTRAA